MVRKRAREKKDRVSSSAAWETISSERCCRAILLMGKGRKRGFSVASMKKGESIKGRPLLSLKNSLRIENLGAGFLPLKWGRGGGEGAETLIFRYRKKEEQSQNLGVRGERRCGGIFPMLSNHRKRRNVIQLAPSPREGGHDGTLRGEKGKTRRGISTLKKIRLNHRS